MDTAECGFDEVSDAAGAGVVDVGAADFAGGVAAGWVACANATAGANDSNVTATKAAPALLSLFI